MYSHIFFTLIAIGLIFLAITRMKKEHLSACMFLVSGFLMLIGSLLHPFTVKFVSQEEDFESILGKVSIASKVLYGLCIVTIILGIMMRPPKSKTDPIDFV